MAMFSSLNKGLHTHVEDVRQFIELATVKLAPLDTSRLRGEIAVHPEIRMLSSELVPADQELLHQVHIGDGGKSVVNSYTEVLLEPKDFFHIEHPAVDLDLSALIKLICQE